MRACRGACWVDPADELLGNLIKVVHFGFHQHNTALPNDFQLMPQKGAACYNPQRDIVTAPYSYRQEATANETYAGFDPTAIPSDRLLFFAGTIKADEPDYSGGVRQVCAWVAVCVRLAVRCCAGHAAGCAAGHTAATKTARQ
jgi:hypothetical protein